jgi:hypothetical protein
MGFAPTSSAFAALYEVTNIFTTAITLGNGEIGFR